jgi:fluoride exporter
MQMIFAIAAGGAIGSLLRHYMNMALSHILPDSFFPWGTFSINILGSFIMGILTAAFTYVWEPSEAARVFLTVGILGGFTTFSTFSLDIVVLMERGSYGAAAFYTAGSVLLAIGSLYGGLWLVRSIAG